MGEPIVILTDADGDTLEIITRDMSDFGNPGPNPVISVRHAADDRCQSVMMTDEQVDQVMKSLAYHFGYQVMKIVPSERKHVRRRVEYDDGRDNGNLIENYPIDLLPQDDQVRNGFVKGTLQKATFETHMGYSVVYEETPDAALVTES